MTWLGEHLAACSLTEDAEGYLLGRAAKVQTIEDLQVVAWQPMESPAPDPTFIDRYGPMGERLTGWVIFPLHSPKGKVIGFHGRPITEKRDTRYLLPEAAWNPVWMGLRGSMERIWAGGDVWLVEGYFDKFPMEWVVPVTDAVLACGRAVVTRKQLEFLRRYCLGWVHVVFDRDQTGREGVHGRVDKTGKRWPGALQRMERADLRCREVNYRGGKDPGEIWDRGGLAGLQAAFPL